MELREINVMLKNYNMLHDKLQFKTFSNGPNQQEYAWFPLVYNFS